MSKIYSLSIKHFRSIENFQQVFGTTNCVVLIGRGDSGKTTLLKAISAVLSPSWNYTFNDYDFTNMDTSIPIQIEVTLIDVYEDLLDIKKYGEYIQLLKEGGTIDPNIENEDPNDKIALKIRLTVTDTLEPNWEVVSDRDIGNKIITASDRAKLNMFMVSDYIDNHFAYSKGSPLYSSIKNSLEKKDKENLERRIVDIGRSIFNSVKDLKPFDEFKETSIKIKKDAQALGLTISDLTTLLEFKNNAYSESNIVLHSLNIPFKLNGKGSKRLLSLAIQYGLAEDGGIVLIDEIEQGLEPDRVRNLTRKLARLTTGQVFITTHSRDVVLEPDAEQIFLMRKGEDHLFTFDEDLQGKLRSKPEAFFAKRIICCEGATEEGIIRAISDDLQENRGYGIAVQGIVHIDCGGGDKFYTMAMSLKKCKFDVLVFCDDDNKDIEKSKNESDKANIESVRCKDGYSIEEQLFDDLPWDAICKLIEYVLNESPTRTDILPVRGFPYRTVEELTSIESEDQENIRKILGKKAKRNGWYKRIDHGEFIGKVWVDNYDKLQTDCILRKEFDGLKQWIGDNII
ncbi:MAG: AAA family ATPase [Prevotella sp.]|nr:AAA family ATPase [Bacteroidaceae bacterium]